MSRFASLLVRAYPPGWRARYGDEFLALLGERPIGPFDVADVLLGAVDAHLHLRGLGAASAHQKGFAMTLRIGGLAAIAAGVLWLVVLAANAINDGAESGAAVIWVALLGATVLTLVALVGLSAFQARRHPVLVWAAFAIPAFGAVMGLVGYAVALFGGDADAPLVAGLTIWAFSAIGVMTMLLGSALFALATWLSTSLSRPAAATLGIGAVLLIPALMGVLGGLLPEVLGIAALIIAIAAFPAGWVGLGISALRLDSAGRVPIEGAPS